MNNTTNATLRIHGPADLLTGVPHLLGFTPEESLVLIGLTHGVLVVTARIDLADTERHPGYVPDTVAAMVRGGTNQFVLAIYTQTHNAAGELAYTALADTVTATIEAAGASVLDRLLVSGGLWWSYQCTDRSCCPLEGRSLPHAPTPFQAAATVAGLTVAPSRVALAARFDPDHDREQLRPLVQRAEQALGPVLVNRQLGLRGRVAVRALTTAMNTANGGAYIELADEDVARAGAALRHTVIRDAIWLEL